VSNYFLALGELLEAEQCSVVDCLRHGPDGEVGDLGAGYLPHLRAMVRSGATPQPSSLLNRVGRSAREDQLVSLLVANCGADSARALRDGIRSRLTAAEHDSFQTAALLDLATEQGMAPLLSGEVSRYISHGLSHVRRAALRHLTMLPRTTENDAALLSAAHTLEDASECAVWSVAAAARGLDEDAILRRLSPQRREIVRLLPRRPERRYDGILIMQLFAMAGAIDTPGTGNSGGLAVFLSTLGTALAQQRGIGQVLTLVQANADDLPNWEDWTAPLAEGHSVLRLPVLRPAERPEYAEPLAEISWWLRVLLPALGLTPDVAHLRFGSDVTLAVARAMLAIGSKTVFTIAPDPHRIILRIHHDASGGLNRMGLVEDLHRMFAADTLSEWADDAIAIPGAQQEDETARFFPQVVRRNGSVEAIPEGICAWHVEQSDETAGRALVERLFCRAGATGLSREVAGEPVLINVGRWNPIKQQDVIVEAWLQARLFDTTAMVLIGGDAENAMGDEQRMRRRIVEMLAAAPGARGRFAWLPRLSNREVRLLERALTSELRTPGPHVYFCGSTKEEFGIAVLEGMEAGLLAIAPRSGGASHYVQPGVTGFLADTSSPQSLAADMKAILGIGRSVEYLREVAEAGQRLVRQEFVIDRSAALFAKRYLQLSNI
jgi:D-inositol-3-phosphate glycosyltransferase